MSLSVEMFLLCLCPFVDIVYPSNLSFQERSGDNSMNKTKRYCKVCQVCWEAAAPLWHFNNWNRMLFFGSIILPTFMHWHDFSLGLTREKSSLLGRRITIVLLSATSLTPVFSLWSTEGKADGRVQKFLKWVF